MDKNYERGSYVRLVDKRLGMVITRWKDSRTLQVVSTVIKNGVGVVKRRTGASVLDEKCPNDIIMHQQNMGGVDHGDQHRVIGAGFANVSHVKKLYKKVYLGIADFSFLQAFTAWNLAIDSAERTRRGRNSKHRKLKKWEFYSAAAEEMLTYADSLEEVQIGRI